MPAYAVIGAQWGDEGKGKIVDYLGDNIQVLNPELKTKKSVAADIVVRANGGNNAGHTLWNPLGEFRLHLAPGGIVNPRVQIAVIGPGVVIDLNTLDAELKTIMDTLGVSLEDLLAKLFISTKAQIVFSGHIMEDFMHEVHRAIDAKQFRGEKDFKVGLSDIQQGIGTTGRGIGPSYADKSGRFGLRIEDLFDQKKFTSKFILAWNRKVRLLESFYLSRKEVSEEVKQEARKMLGKYVTEKDRLLELGEKFRGSFRNVERMLYEANRESKHILFEGAQGFHLDIDHGTYPYVTSSNCGIAGLSNAGITRFNEVIGVFKAYCTRVGSGDLTTEMIDDDDAQYAKLIREVAHEYGVTTGRPRRIGWLDLAALRHSVILNGITSSAITRLDIFDDIDFGPKKLVKVGVGYNCAHLAEERERQQKNFPQVSDLYCDDFDHYRQNGGVEPVYEELKSWGPVPVGSGHAKVHGQRSIRDLPQRAREYIARAEKFQGVPIRIISTGPKRDDTIIVAIK